MEKTIAKLQQLLPTCVFGETVNDRSEALKFFVYGLEILHAQIKWKLDNRQISSHFLETYQEFLQAFDNLSTADGDLIAYYEGNCRHLLNVLKELLRWD